jgi:hypothetical protein
MQIQLKTLGDNALWKVDIVKKGINLRAFMDYVF